MKYWLARALLIGLTATAPASAQLRDRLMGEEWFSRADANHDGVVTRPEYQGYRVELFGRLDRNSDGMVSPADFPRLASAGPKAYRRLTQVLEEADRNNDGAVSREELNASPMRFFDRLDSDRDGKVTAAEAAAFRDKMENFRNRRAR